MIPVDFHQEDSRTGDQKKQGRNPGKDFFMRVVFHSVSLKHRLEVLKMFIIDKEFKNSNQERSFSKLSISKEKTKFLILFIV